MYLLTPACVIVFTVLLTLLAVAAVGIRLAQRKLRHLQAPIDALIYGWYLDDILCTVALLLCFPSSGIIIWGAVKGSVGGHSSPEDAQHWIQSATPAWEVMAKVVWVCLWLQPIILGCVKLAILFLCRRIFRLYNSFNIVSWVMVGLVTGFMITFAIGLFFDCGTDIAANWGSLSEIGAKCKFGFLPTVIYTIIDACFDLIILVLPLPWIFQLQMKTSKKLAVCGAFLLGGIATAAAFVRMAICIETGIPAAALNRQTVMGLPAWDILGIVSTQMFWHMVETTVAITAACLPAIRAVITRAAIGKWLSLTSISEMFRSMRSSAGSRAGFELESGTNRSRSGALSRSESREQLRDGGIQTGVNGKTTTRVASGKAHGTVVEIKDEGIFRVDTFTCDTCKQKQCV